MEFQSRKIDHLVYCVPNLEEAIEAFHLLTGVRPTLGGRHPNQGTRNALVSIGTDCYLEFLAADPSNKSVQPPRWMGIDLILEPRITRWALRSENIERDQTLLKGFYPQLSQLSQGARAKPDGSLLEWEMTLPIPHPQVELIPFFIEWAHGCEHPAENIDSGCTLTKIALFHPNGGQVEKTYLNTLFESCMVTRNEAVKIQAELRTPKGIVII